MRIGIIGAGNVGTGLGKWLAASGHDIVVSFARSADKVADAARTIGGGARPGTVIEAATFGEVSILATPWSATEEAIEQARAGLVGKILWDATNALRPDLSGLAIGTTTSGGEEVARLATGARVVKAIPPFAEALHGDSLAVGGTLPSVFVCGDDAEARRVVAGLVEQTGADAVDAGPLALARYTEPAGMLLVQLAYVQGMGTDLGLRLLR
jgi:predicted dinucleotide-binding enzyme